MSCLPLRKLFSWMTGLHAGKTKEELRPSQAFAAKEPSERHIKILVATE